MSFILIAVITAVILLNLFAVVHARAMTHLVPGGSKTPTPESLGLMAKLRILMSGVQLPKPINLRDPKSCGLQFQTIRLASSQPSLELWKIPCNESRGTILMFAGYATAKDTLLPAAQLFHQLDYDCVLADFRACGGSDGVSSSIGFHEAEDVRRVVEFAHATPSSTPVIVYAASMGAAAVLRAVWLHQISPAALILECPFDSLLNTVKHRFTAMRLPAFPLAHLLVFWGGILMRFNPFKHNPATYAQKAHCPVLLMHGGKDPRVTVEEVQQVYRAFPGIKTFKLFPHLAHETYVGACPEEWLSAVRGFLDPLGNIASEVQGS